VARLSKLACKSFDGASPPALRKGFAFPAHRMHFIPLRAACPDAGEGGAERVYCGAPQRKGGAFPQSMRRSRKPIAAI